MRGEPSPATPEQVRKDESIPWQEIEVNPRDEKTILGVGQAQVRNVNSVASVPTAAVAAYAMLHVAAMTAEGACRNTQKQFFQCLENSDGFFPEVGKSVTLESANALWVEQTFPILGNFEKAVTEKYGAEICAADFIGQSNAGRLKINTWVEQQTQDKIKDLFPEGFITSLTRLVLANAVYFKGDWFHAFDPKKT